MTLGVCEWGALYGVSLPVIILHPMNAIYYLQMHSDPMSYPRLNLLQCDRFQDGSKGCFYWVRDPMLRLLNHFSHITYYGCSCRDTLFIGGCGRFFEGTSEEMINALAYLGSLPDDTVVYNGHEYTSGNVAFGLSVCASIQMLCSD